MKITLNSYGNFVCHKIKIVREINILEQNKEVVITSGPRICVFGNEEDRVLD